VSLMTGLMFVGRWAWIALIAVSLLIGAYLFRTIGEFEDSADLVSEVGELREYQDQVLQAQIAIILTGQESAVSPADLVREAEAEAEALIPKVDPNHHACDGTCAPGAEDPTHDHAIATSIELVIDDLWSLANLSVVEATATGQPSDPGTASVGGLAPNAAAEQEVDLVALFGLIVRYAELSASVTGNLDDAMNGLAAEGHQAAERIQVVGQIGIATLLIGGMVSAGGFAWAGRRARKLSWDVERAQEMDALKSEFVGLASHELRTPLAGIYGFSELLQAEPDLSPHASGWVDRINDESRRLSAIVDALLNLSRIEAGEIEVGRGPVELEQVVDAVLRMFEDTGETHPISVEGSLDVTVIGDRTNLVQVLSNIVDNAVKYSPEGGRVRITAEAVADELCLRVADEGLGIAPHDLPLVFDRFHRGERPGTEHIRSTGLGLYLVKELVERMGGRVSVESELNEGTTLSLVLPLAEHGIMEQAA